MKPAKSKPSTFSFAAGSGKSHVLIGKADPWQATFTPLLLPNGERAFLLDEEVYKRALHAADEKFGEAVEQMRASRDRTRRERAA